MPKKILLGALPPLLIYTLVFILRIPSIKSLLENKPNVITCYDCFYYARLVKEKVLDTITPIDYLKNVPDFAVNNDINSLVVLLPVSIIKAFDLQLETIVATLPPLLAPLFIIPLYLWIRDFSGIYTFLGASLLGVFNTIYWIRTRPGRYDTDFLILFFLFLTLWLIYLGVKTSDRKRGLTYVLLGGITLNTFMWWYPKPIFIFLFSVSLILGGIAFSNPTRDIFYKFTLLIVAGGVGNLIKGVAQLVGYVESRVLYEKIHFVPMNFSRYIVELQPVDFKQLTAFTSENYVFTVLYFVGLVFLVFKERKSMSVALPFVAMGLSVFVSGNRMLMYLAPFLGMGVGYLIGSLVNLLEERTRFKTALKTAGTALVVFSTFSPSALIPQDKPMFSNLFYSEVSKLSSLTKEGSYVWTWWDFGNLIQYAAQRGTFTDNGNWHPVKMFAIAHSFMLEDEDLMRKIIAYTTNVRNLHVIYKDKTYKDFLKEAYAYDKPLKEDVYVVITPDMFLKPFLINLGSFGTNYERFKKVPYASDIIFCKEKEDLYDCGVVVLTKKDFKPVSPYDGDILLVDRHRGVIKALNRSESAGQEDFVLLVIKDKAEVFAIQIRRFMLNSMLTRMALIGENIKGFEIVYDRFPYIVVYRVKREDGSAGS